jgi:N-acetylglucosamine-6-phosphate deacetylase
MKYVTAIFEASGGEWDVEAVPPEMEKLAIIRRAGSGVRLQAAARRHGVTSRLATLDRAEYATLAEAADAIAEATGGACKLHDG